MQSKNSGDLDVLSGGQKGFITRTYFPEVIDEKIVTTDFLSAASEVVRIVEKLGKMFAPVRYDMQGNINKLNTRFATDKERNATLQDMILFEGTTTSNLVATDALMWLTRALHMILLFFENIIEDHKKGTPTEDLVAVLRIAYKSSLEPYHGWMAQQLFSLLSRAVPTRTQLLEALTEGQNVEDDAFLKEMESYLVNLRKNVETVQDFYQKNNLENTNAV